MTFSCSGGIAGSYRVHKIKKRKVVSRWIGRGDFDQLTGVIFFKKNGKDKMFVDPESKKSINPRRRMVMETDSVVIGDYPFFELKKSDQGLLFFDPDRNQFIISSEIESSCFWESDWFARFILSNKDMEAFGCSD